MNLASLIKYGITPSAASANPANAANDQASKTAQLAKLATLALAKRTESDTEAWREFESLLAIVGPAHDTPAHEYPKMRQAAANDLPAAILAFRDMADRIKER